MKKIVCLIWALICLIAFVSCGNDAGVASSSSQPVTTSSTENSGDNPDTGEAKWLTLVESEKEQKLYPVIEAGQYKGTEFINVPKGAYYRVIENYEDLCRLTAYGANLPESIFEDSVVLALHRHEGVEDIGRIGYHSLDITENGVSLTVSAWYGGYWFVDAWEWTETVYLRVPVQEYESQYGFHYGELELKREEIRIFDNTEVYEIDGDSLEDGVVSFVNPGELEQFLNELGITEMPFDWMREVYTSGEYTVLAYITREIRDGAYYGGISISGAELRFTYSYTSDANKETGVFLNLVAIPLSCLEDNEYETVSVTNLEYLVGKLLPDSEITQTVIAQTSVQNYYQFLDLGIYYYEELFSELLGDEKYGYDIITSYDELCRSVQDPFLSPSFFEENCVIVLRLGMYITLNNQYGIKSIELNKNDSTICVQIDEVYNVEKLEEYRFYIYYVSVPKEELGIQDAEMEYSFGEANVTVNGYSSTRMYRYSSQREYDFDENKFWLITNYYEKESFYNETGVNISAPNADEFWLVYYGKTGSSTVLEKFESTGERIYITLRYVDGLTGNECKFYAVKIKESLLNCYAAEVTVYVNVIVMSQVTLLENQNKEDKILNSEYASHYGAQNLIKVPEFTYKILTNDDEYFALIAEYTTLEQRKIDFERYNLIAYYKYEGCTGCPSATTFANVNCGNGKMYIEKLVEDHWGGAAMTHSLYLILVEKEYFTDDISKILFVEKRGWEVLEDGDE